MIKEYKMYLVNAFSNRAFTGNATGVVIDNGNMDEKDMQNIAKDLNQSETVFIKKLDVNRYSTRFFTKEGEIDLCGHATIATFYALAEEEYIIPIDEGEIKIIQHTKCGKIPVCIDYMDGKVTNVKMRLALKEKQTQVTKEEIEKILGISKDKIGLNDEEFPIKKISSGICDLVVPIKDEESLQNIKLDYQEAKKLVEREEAISILAFTSDDFRNISQRTFSPGIDIFEEPGSGTSAATVLHYLRSLNLSKTGRITCTQGSHMDRTSKVYAQYLDEFDMTRVMGRGFVFMTGVLKI